MSTAPDPHLRPGTPDDLDEVERVLRAAGRVGWSDILPPAALEELRRPPRWAAAAAGEGMPALIVAEQAGGLAGFTVVRRSEDPGAGMETGEIEALYTDPAVWGGGVGRALVRAGLDALAAAGFREATLWTPQSYKRARRLYERAGMRRDGALRHRRYRGGSFIEVRYRTPLPAPPAR